MIASWFCFVKQQHLCIRSIEIIWGDRHESPSELAVVLETAVEIIRRALALLSEPPFEKEIAHHLPDRTRMRHRRGVNTSDTETQDCSILIATVRLTLISVNTLKIVVLDK